MAPRTPPDAVDLPASLGARLVLCRAPAARTPTPVLGPAQHPPLEAPGVPTWRGTRPPMPSSAPPPMAFVPSGDRTPRLRPRARLSSVTLSPSASRGSIFSTGAWPDLAPGAEDAGTLTFDPVAAVKGDLAVDLGLVGLDRHEQPPGHRAVQLPLGPRALGGRQRVLGPQWEGRPARDRDRVTGCGRAGHALSSGQSVHGQGCVEG